MCRKLKKFRYIWEEKRSMSCFFFLCQKEQNGQYGQDDLHTGHGKPYAIKLKDEWQCQNDADRQKDLTINKSTGLLQMLRCIEVGNGGLGQSIKNHDKRKSRGSVNDQFCCCIRGAVENRDLMAKQEHQGAT